MAILSDSTNPPKINSKTIVDLFVSMNVKRQQVVLANLGTRTKESVYNSLRYYCRRHAKLNVKVTAIDGVIHLERTDLDDAAVHGDPQRTDLDTPSGP